MIMSMVFQKRTSKGVNDVETRRYRSLSKSFQLGYELYAIISLYNNCISILDILPLISINTPKLSLINVFVLINLSSPSFYTAHTSLQSSEVNRTRLLRSFEINLKNESFQLKETLEFRNICL